MAGFTDDSIDKFFNHSFIRSTPAAGAMSRDSSMMYDNNKSTDRIVTSVVTILTALS